MAKAIEAQNHAVGKPPAMYVTGPTNDTLCLRLSGDWRMGQPIPSLGEMEKQFAADSRIKKITFDSSKIADWDSSLLTFLMDIHNCCSSI